MNSPVMLAEESHVTFVSCFTDEFGRPEGVASYLGQHHAMRSAL